ncbi:hypothetical protein [Streptococcus pseudoporcinus]|nr:hypothetical protein [Streptococcus pseudoporcinus]
MITNGFSAFLTAISEAFEKAEQASGIAKRIIIFDLSPEDSIAHSIV